MVFCNSRQAESVSTAIMVIEFFDNSCVCCSGGQYINFDLAWPSSAIPDDFFPSNVSLYGKIYVYLLP